MNVVQGEKHTFYSIALKFDTEIGCLNLNDKL